MQRSVHTPERGKEFADLVYQVVVAEKRWPAAEIAGRLGMKYDAFYSRLSNRVKFTAEEIRSLIACAPDARFVTYLLRETPFVGAERVLADADEKEQEIHRGATRIVLEASDVLEKIEEALRDHRIDHREARTIMACIEEAELAVATLREQVRKFT